MMIEPQVSVIIPSYNSANHLSHAIESVLSQSFQAFELVIVDDGSTDNTREVVAGYESDARVRYVRLPENRGPSAARNVGVHESTCELVAFLDADDGWLPQMLEVVTTALGNPTFGVCSVAAFCKWPDGTQSLIAIDPRTDRDELYHQLLFRNVLPASASGTVVRRACFDEVGFFDENLRGVEDRDLWIRLAARYPFVFVDTPLVYLNRRRNDSAIRDSMRMARGREGFLRNREKDMPVRFRPLLPLLRRATYFRLARAYDATGDAAACRRYSLLALRSHARVDKVGVRVAALLLRSLLPSRAAH